MNSSSTTSARADFPTASERRRHFTQPLFDARNPFAAKLVCDISDASVDQAIATIRKSAFKGADAFNLNVSRLNYRDLGEVKTIFDQIQLPIFTAVRRANFLSVYGDLGFTARQQSEAERVETHLRCLDFGSVGVDLELDTFHADKGKTSLRNEIRAGVDERRAELLGPIGDISFDDDAIGLQKEAIAKVKANGGFALLSSHTARAVDTDEVQLIVRSAVERGADFVKMVVRTKTLEDQDELIRASLVLRRTTDVPFILMPMGQSTVATRMALFLLGGAWAITQADFVPGGFHQQALIETWLPMVNALRAS